MYCGAPADFKSLLPVSAFLVWWKIYNELGKPCSGFYVLKISKHLWKHSHTRTCQVPVETDHGFNNPVLSGNPTDFREPHLVVRRYSAGLLNVLLDLVLVWFLLCSCNSNNKSSKVDYAQPFKSAELIFTLSSRYEPFLDQIPSTLILFFSHKC